MKLIDYREITCHALAQIGYTARFATYVDEGVCHFGEIIDRSGNVFESSDLVFDLCEAEDWVDDRGPEIVLEALIKK